MTKDILKDYQGLLLEEKQLEELLEEWEAKAVSVGYELDGMPHGKGTSNPTARYAVKIAEIRRLLEKKHMEVINELKRIETAIEGLTRAYYRYVLREYYINDKTFEQIAVNMNYSIQQVWRIHGWALQEINLERLC